MSHSRLTFNSNRPPARPATDSTPPFRRSSANKTTPFDDLYEHAYSTARNRSGTPPGSPGLRAA